MPVNFVNGQRGENYGQDGDNAEAHRIVVTKPRAQVVTKSGFFCKGCLFIVLENYYGQVLIRKLNEFTLNVGVLEFDVF